MTSIPSAWAQMLGWVGFKLFLTIPLPHRPGIQATWTPIWNGIRGRLSKSLGLEPSRFQWMAVMEWGASRSNPHLHILISGDLGGIDEERWRAELSAISTQMRLAKIDVRKHDGSANGIAYVLKEIHLSDDRWPIFSPALERRLKRRGLSGGIGSSAKGCAYAQSLSKKSSPSFSRNECLVPRMYHREDDESGETESFHDEPKYERSVKGVASEIGDASQTIANPSPADHQAIAQPALSLAKQAVGWVANSLQRLIQGARAGLCFLATLRPFHCSAWMAGGLVSQDRERKYLELQMAHEEELRSEVLCRSPTSTLGGDSPSARRVTS